MNKLSFLPVTGVLVGTMLTVAACGPTGTSHSAAAPSTQAAPASSAVSTSATAADTGATAFASALAEWKDAAAANAATMGLYLQKAADDLKGSGYPGSSTAIDQLTYLEHLPATNDTPTQQANAHSDVKALDTFFGTPGLMS